MIAILKATGKPVDEAQVDAVLKSLNNRKVDDVLAMLLRSSARDFRRSLLVLLQPRPRKSKRRSRRRKRPRRRKSPRRRSPSLLLPLKMRTSTWISSADLNPIIHHSYQPAVHDSSIKAKAS